MTSTPPNPYAPPATAEPYAGVGPGEGPTAVWRDGVVAVCAKGSPWPDRCVRCNEPAQGFRLERRLYWHSPWVYALIFAGVLIYVIVALIVRKTATVDVGLCPRHRAMRRNGLLIGWLGALASVATCSVTVEQSPGTAFGVGFLGVIASLIAGVVMTRVVLPSRIDDTHAWVRCGRPFIDSLPPVDLVRGTYR